MTCLRGHFSGEGNTSRRMEGIERMKETLHYKLERSLVFENFLTKCQNMYNIYDTHGEKISEEAKIRFLFKKINHERLVKTVEAMTIKIATEVIGVVTYTTIANYISTAVSELPDYLLRNRNVSGVTNTRVGSQSGPGPHYIIFNQNNTIHTGHHSTWMTTMDTGDKKKVHNERAKLGLGRYKKKNSFTSNTNKNRRSSNNMNQLTRLKATNAKYKRTIASLKSTTAEESPSNSDVEMSDTGNVFGGKAKKSKY